MSQEEPTVQNDPGKADEYFARLIIIAPWALAVAALITLNVAMTMRMLVFDVTITGSVNAQYALNTIVKPIAFGLAALLGLAYILATAKEWGLSPIRKLADLAKDYNP